MTNAMAETVADLAGAMVDSAVRSLGEAIGATVAADSVEVVAAVDEAAYEGATAARTMITGQAPGGLVTIIPSTGLAAGENTIAATDVINALAAGAAATMGEALGAELQVAPAEALNADPSAAGLASTIISFSVGTSPTSLVPVFWIVEASLDALLTQADPVIPNAAAASSVAPAELPDLGAGAPPGSPQDLHLLSDVQMNVTVELGRAVMQVRDLLSLREGSIVELDRAAGAAVDVLVNGTLVARGEVVVIDDELGVRVTELVER